MATQSFASLTHAARHASGGADPVTPYAIGINPSSLTAPSGMWQAPMNAFNGGTMTAVTSGLLTFCPHDVGPKPVTYQALGVGVGTAQVAGSTATTVALYPDNGSGGYPNMAAGPLYSGTVVLTAAGNATYAVSMPNLLGRYWLAFLYVATVAPTTVAQVYAISNVAPNTAQANGVTIGSASGRGWTATGQTAMPTTQIVLSSSGVTNVAYGCLRAT